jgi:CRISPR/Cas system CSM-associated protein Csm3 (group 7 of RAMP superfamily)
MRSSYAVVIEGWLNLKSPLHVGGIGGEVDTDLVVARDGLGRPVIPGTSLAGSLRELACQCWPVSLDPVDVDRWFGWVGGSDKGWASQISIDDVIVVASPSNPVEPRFIERSGVSLSRKYGTAEDGFLFTRNAVAAGAALFVRIAVVSPSASGTDCDQVDRIANWCLSVMNEGSVRLGAKRSTGFGQLTALHENRLGARVMDRRSRAGFLASLGAASNAFAAPKNPLNLPSSQSLRITMDLKGIGPVMIKSAIDGLAVDMLPHLEQNQAGDMDLVVPATSVKGAIRAHAERIMLTVTGESLIAGESQQLTHSGKAQPLEETSAQGGLEASAGTAGESDDDSRVPTGIAEHSELVGWLFGSGPVVPWNNDQHRQSPARSSDSALPRRETGLGALFFDDLRVGSGFSGEAVLDLHTGIGPEVEVDPGEKQHAELTNARVDELERAGFSIGEHVAIDRWTGGASDGALYTVLEAHSPEFGQVCFTVNPARIPHHIRKPAIALLYLLVSELIDGYVPLGFGVNQGNGDVAATNVRWIGLESFTEWAAPLSSGALRGALNAGLDHEEFPEAMLSELRGAWTNWIEVTTWA